MSPTPSGRDRTPVEVHEFDSFCMRQDQHNEKVSASLKSISDGQIKMENDFMKHAFEEGSKQKQFVLHLRIVSVSVIVIAVANFPGLLHLWAEIRKVVP